jgi:hypothetical protein
MQAELDKRGHGDKMRDDTINPARPENGGPQGGGLANLTRELQHLARTDPDGLARRIDAMTTLEQAEFALRLPAGQRLELLLNAPRPHQLIRALPDAELYLTVREVGPADALPLLALASPAQLIHLLDLESWRKDRFDAERSGAWLATILEAGEPALERVLQAMDDDLLALLFDGWMGIKQIETIEDPEIHGHGEGDAGTEEGYPTPDGFCRFSPRRQEHVASIRRLLQILFSKAPKRYGQVIWDSQWELHSEIEEKAYHWRQSRMEEHGFPPWDEAVSIYAAATGRTTHPLPQQPLELKSIEAPRSPLRILPQQTPLAGAIDSLPDGDRERILHEIVSLANHVLIADGRDTGDPEDHASAIAKAMGCVALALSKRGATDAAGVAESFGRIPLVELFREGYALIAALGTRAAGLKQDGWAAAHPQALALLDSPIRERVEGLLAERPLFFELGVDDKKGVYRDFHTPEEVEEAQVALEMAETFGRLLIEEFGLDVTRVMRARRSEEARPVSFGTFLLTAMAWHHTTGELRGVPLPLEEASRFLQEVAIPGSDQPALTEQALSSLIDAVHLRSPLTPREKSVFHAFGTYCLERLAEECRKLDVNRPVDPRRIPSLLLADPA